MIIDYTAHYHLQFKMLILEYDLFRHENKIHTNIIAEMNKTGVIPYFYTYLFKADKESSKFLADSQNRLQLGGQVGKTGNTVCAGIRDAAIQSG